MQKAFLAAAAIVAMTGMAHADPFDSAYGNTVTTTAPDGSKTVAYVNRDGTWEQHRGGEVMKGTFAWKDATHACFTLVDPAPKDAAKATNCEEIKGEHKVGDTWTDTGPKGETYTMAITAGR